MQELIGHDLGRRRVTYEERDAILYALAVGASATETELVYERDLHVLPTFGLTLGLWAVEAAGGLGAYDWHRTLHVGQQLRTRDALPPRGHLEIAARIGAVWDKGSSALVDVVAEADEFEIVYRIFVPGAGGFGGPAGPPAPAAQGPVGPPDLQTTVPTREDQAALYRLTGDLHPLHIDPEVAAANGFAAPILHGLCALGMAALAIAQITAHRPWELTGLQTRFTAPVYPGAQLDLSVWRHPDERLHFQAETAGGVALQNGEAVFGSDGANSP